MRSRRLIILVAIIACLAGVLGGFALRHFLPISDWVTQVMSSLDGSDTAPVGGSTLLVETALETAQAIQSQDYETLSSMVHPKTGVTFSPSATVDRTANQTFSADDIAKADRSSATYVWGTTSDAASPINMTITDYFSAYVWDKNYLSDPQISVNSIQSSGNALENVADAYPDGQYVEFYCPAGNGQSDWAALKLVFEWYQDHWYLVGVIHSGWSA